MIAPDEHPWVIIVLTSFDREYTEYPIYAFMDECSVCLRYTSEQQVERMLCWRLKQLQMLHRPFQPWPPSIAHVSR